MQCGPHEKLCAYKRPDDSEYIALHCVGLDDPNYGCGSPDCDSCRIPNAQAVCNERGECVVGGCVEGHADCEKDEDGCETYYTDNPEHCGNCDTKCTLLPHTTKPKCKNGFCSPDCAQDFGDCDDIPENGCETYLPDSGDPKNCFINNSDGKCVPQPCDMEAGIEAGPQGADTGTADDGASQAEVEAERDGGCTECTDATSINPAMDGPAGRDEN